MNNKSFDELFKSVWNNIYIRSIIFKHLKLYSIFFEHRIFDSSKELMEFEYKDYLYSVFILNYVDNENGGDYYYQDLKRILPNNIEIIESYNTQFKNYQIPNFITNCIVMDEFQFSIFQNVTNNLKVLTIDLDAQYIPEFKCNDLPSSLIELSIGGYNYPIKKDTLPKQLQKLYVIRHKDIEEGALPDSLTFLETSMQRTPLKMKPGYLPSGLKQFNFINFNFKNDYFYQDLSFLKSLIKLKIHCNNISNIILPSNLKVLDIKAKRIKETIQYPQSLEKLSHLVLKYKLNHQQNQFNNQTIPDNLKKLKFNSTHLLDSNGISIFKNKNLLNLELFSTQPLLNLNNNNNNNNNKSFKLFFKNLFTLNNESIPFIKENIFCESLTFLNFSDDFNEPLIGINLLPPNLKTLILGNQYDHQIGIGVLPSKLKTLIIGKKFNQEFLNESLVSSLELIEIKNQNYDKFPIKTCNNLTIVDCDNYYKQFDQYPEGLYSLKLPSNSVDSPPLDLKKYINLEYISFNNVLYEDYQFSNSFSKDNKIKTIDLGGSFHSDLDLNYFKNLQFLIIGYSNPKITFKNIETLNNNLIIKVPFDNVKFLNNINSNLYQFLQLTF